MLHYYLIKQPETAEDATIIITTNVLIPDPKTMELISHGQIRLYLDGSGIYLLPPLDQVGPTPKEWSDRQEADTTLIENHLKGLAS